MLRIVAFSDTHGFEVPLPPGDILIHAGDATFTGSEKELRKFRKYMERQPHKHKIFVPGNHELTMDIDHAQSNELWRKWLGPKIEILHLGKTMNINGLKIAGTPMQPAFGKWAFGADEQALKTAYSFIPKDTNVLVTHCPPYGVLDRSARGIGNLGSMALRERLEELAKGSNLYLHIFGHIHEGAGFEVVRNTMCANVSILDENYKLKNKPFVFDVPAVLNET